MDALTEIREALQGFTKRRIHADKTRILVVIEVVCTVCLTH